MCGPHFQVGFGHSFLGTDCNRTTISRGQETGSTLSAVSIYGHRFSAFLAKISFCFLQGVLSEVMADADSEMRFLDVPEKTEEDLVITVSGEERTQNIPPSWAERVENTESHLVQHGRLEYPVHLRSEIYSFDGILPPQSLDELSETDRARLYRLNGVPNRPCSARFRLCDNSMDARTMLDHITSTGVMRNHINVSSAFSLDRLRLHSLL